MIVCYKSIGCSIGKYIIHFCTDTSGRAPAFSARPEHVSLMHFEGTPTCPLACCSRSRSVTHVLVHVDFRSGPEVLYFQVGREVSITVLSDPDLFHECLPKARLGVFSYARPGRMCLFTWHQRPHACSHACLPALFMHSHFLSGPKNTCLCQPRSIAPVRLLGAYYICFVCDFCFIMCLGCCLIDEE